MATLRDVDRRDDVKAVDLTLGVFEHDAQPQGFDAGSAGLRQPAAASLDDRPVDDRGGLAAHVTHRPEDRDGLAERGIGIVVAVLVP